MVIILVVVKGTGYSFSVTRQCTSLPETSQKSNFSRMRNTRLKKMVALDFFHHLLDQIRKTVELIALIAKVCISQEK